MHVLSYNIWRILNLGLLNEHFKPQEKRYQLYDKEGDFQMFWLVRAT